MTSTSSEIARVSDGDLSDVDRARAATASAGTAIGARSRTLSLAAGSMDARTSAVVSARGTGARSTGRGSVRRLSSRGRCARC